MSEEIKEGSYYSYNPNNYQNSNIIQPGGNEPQNQPTVDTPFQDFDKGDILRSWQEELLKTLYSGNDAYVIAPPGAGKTLPVTFYWLKRFIFFLGQNDKSIMSTSLDINGRDETRLDETVYDLATNPRRFKKLIYVVPIRALAQEVKTGFITTFIQIFKYYQELRANDTYRHFTFQNDMQIRQLAERLVAMRTGAGVEGDIDSAPVVIMTAGSLANEIGNISKSSGFFIFDEAHVYQPTDKSGNRSQDNEVRNAHDLDRILKSVSSNNPSAQISFLSGTIHPTSAAILCKYMNALYNRKFPEKPFAVIDFKNTTPINVIADDSLVNEENVANIAISAINRHEKNIAIIVFSKAKIDRIVDIIKAKIAKRNPLELKHTPHLKNDNIGFFRNSSKLTAKETYKEKIERIRATPGAEGIKNNDLREAVSYGVGYIYRMDDSVSSTSQMDNEIVQDLYKKGIVNVIISTTAIGVGINFDIQKMYIPSLEKPETTPDGKMQKMQISDRELVQLINRVGRGAFSHGEVYTISQNTGAIAKAINTGVDDFEKNVPVIAVPYEGPRLTYVGFIRILQSIPNIHQKISSWDRRQTATIVGNIFKRFFK